MFGLWSDCKHMVKYTQLSFEITTIKGPVTVPISIGGVKIKPELIQAAGEILQILDWLQYSACQRIHQLKKIHDIPAKTISNLVLKQDEDAHMIANFAILLISACKSPETFEKVLADWIANTLPRAKQGSAKRERPAGAPLTRRPSKGGTSKGGWKMTSREAGRIPRIFPVSKLEENVSRAAVVFPYLSQAISKKEPFDIKKSIEVLTGSQ